MIGSPGGHNVELDIDYPTIVETLQRENERLRLRIFALKQPSSLTAIRGMIDLAAVKHFLEKNYIAIAAASMIILVISAIIGFLQGK